MVRDVLAGIMKRLSLGTRVGLIAVSMSLLAAHGAEYVNEQHGFSFEMPRSCEEMPAPIFKNMLKTLASDKALLPQPQYVTAIQCDNMPWFEYPYFLVEYRSGDFSRFVNEDGSLPVQAKTLSQNGATLPLVGSEKSLNVEMPAISVDHERKIIFSGMDAKPGGFAVKDMGAGFFREDAMVFLHFYVPHRLAQHFTPLFDQAVASFRFSKRLKERVTENGVSALEPEKARVHVQTNKVRTKPHESSEVAPLSDSDPKSALKHFCNESQGESCPEKHDNAENTVKPEKPLQTSPGG